MHTSIIIFGITGDLARRQLLPALYHLIADGIITDYTIIGVAPQIMEPAALWERAVQFMGAHDAQKLAEIIAHTKLFAGDVTDQTIYKNLRIFLADASALDNSNHLIYCSTPSHLFDAITIGCSQVGIISKKPAYAAPWDRVVYEKPFGYDQASARALNEVIAQHLNEDQIFRIDHFLTKEMVSNIALIRFTNAVFEPLWNHRFIDQIQIIAAESIGIEGRGTYYDAYGALRDVMQNHMLQLVALIGMETPTKLNAEAIRNERAKVLQAFSCTDGIYGQYEGYLQEPQIKQDSKTETFALLKCAINMPRWQGVPIYLMTGKKMAHKETVIYIKFKTVDCLLTKQCPAPANWLTIRVAPEAVFSLTLNGKNPKKADETVPIEMSFCQSCQFLIRTTQAYEQAIMEVLNGEQSASVRFDEIDASWQFIDAVKKKQFPLYQYEPGTSGPKEVMQFEHNHGIRWHE